MKGKRATKSAASPKAPKTYDEFTLRFPELSNAWAAMGAAARAAGPLDERCIRLAKLGIAIGAQREGAVRAAVRHALSAGVTLDAIEHVVALSATTVGAPGAVAAWTWVRHALPRR